MRSSSQSVSPSARWSGCSATSVKHPVYRGRADGTAPLGSRPVAPRYLVMLLALGAIWGASYLFNEIALDELEPAPLIEGRFLLALAFLVCATRRHRGAADDRRGGTSGAKAARRRGAPERRGALPAHRGGQQYVDSGLTGILLASSPIFTALVALVYDRSERATGTRLAGVLLGFAGVAVLIGVRPAGGADALAGALAIVVAAFLYSASGLYIGRRLADVPRLAVALGTTLWAAAIPLPLALLEAPSELPGWTRSPPSPPSASAAPGSRSSCTSA